MQSAADIRGTAADESCHGGSPVACLEHCPPDDAIPRLSYLDTAPARAQAGTLDARMVFLRYTPARSNAIGKWWCCTCVEESELCLWIVRHGFLFRSRTHRTSAAS